MIAKRTADQQHIAHAQGLCTPVNVGGDRAHSSGVDKQFIRRAALYNLGVAGDDGNSRFARGCRHAVNDGFQRLHW